MKRETSEVIVKGFLADAFGFTLCERIWTPVLWIGGGVILRKGEIKY